MVLHLDADLFKNFVNGCYYHSSKMCSYQWFQFGRVIKIIAVSVRGHTLELLGVLARYHGDLVAHHATRWIDIALKELKKKVSRDVIFVLCENECQEMVVLLHLKLVSQLVL